LFRYQLKQKIFYNSRWSNLAVLINDLLFLSKLMLLLKHVLLVKHREQFISLMLTSYPIKSTADASEYSANLTPSAQRMVNREKRKWPRRLLPKGVDCCQNITPCQSI